MRSFIEMHSILKIIMEIALNLISNFEINKIILILNPLYPKKIVKNANLQLKHNDRKRFR